MAILTSEHLFDQAGELLTLFPGRKPRQTEIRRAISAAYYGLYHFVLKQAADEFVGARYGTQSPPAPVYVLAYRSASHTWLHSLCADVAKLNVPDRLKVYLNGGSFGSDLRKFASGLADLQEKRHTADYDPSTSLNRTQALSAIASARSAIGLFQAVPLAERRLFLALLLFPPRKT